MDKSNHYPKIIMLATACDLSNILFTHLSTTFTISKVVVENPITKPTLIKNRIRKIGLLRTLGQVVFLMIISKPQHYFSSKRKAEILLKANLADLPIPAEKIIHVSSINNHETINIIKAENPDLIIVNGTRIISTTVLSSTKAKFINIHAGITPLYRGVHGAYWALAMKDLEHCGVTIHYIDKGIDTGGILRQGIITPEKIDNFSTYPYLQFSLGVKLFSEVINDFINNTLNEKKAPTGLSKLWYHPTIWEYLRYRLKNNVK